MIFVYYASSTPPTSTAIIATLVRVTAAALTVLNIAAASAAAAFSPPCFASMVLEVFKGRPLLAFFAFFFAHQFCQCLHSLFLSFTSQLSQLSMFLSMRSIWCINIMFIIAPMLLDDP